MDITRNFFIENEKLTVHYNSSERKAEEKGIVDAFPFYKISVLLTDGLEARFTSGAAQTLKTGEVIIFSPYQAHYGRFLRNGHFEYIEFYLPVNFVENKELLNFLSGTADSFSVDASKYIELFYSFADVLISGSEDMISSYFTVFADFLRKLCISRKAGEKVKMPPVLKQAIEYISRDFINIEGLFQIARSCGCSEKYITALFKKQMGITAYEYLIKTKLNNAKGILLSGGSVTSACYDSGFSDYSHFIQIFKKHYGVTPNRFKKH